ncbi:hypothetical protein D3C80_1617510 [compost metagenome]
MIAIQGFELQCFTAQAGNQFGKASAVFEQVAVAQVQLLALGIVDTQVKGVALGTGFTAAGHLAAQGLERAHLAEAWQAPHQWQDSRVEGAHQLAGLGRAEFQLPKAEDLYQAGDEILA